MKRKISKIFGVGLALVLVLSLSLVAAVPVVATQAQPVYLSPQGVSLQTGPDGIAQWSSVTAHSGSYSAYLSDDGVGYTGGNDYGAGRVVTPAVDILLADIASLSYWFNRYQHPDVPYGEGFATPYMTLAIDTADNGVADGWIVLWDNDAGYEPAQGEWVNWNLNVHNRWLGAGTADFATIGVPEGSALSAFIAETESGGGLEGAVVLAVKVSVGEWHHDTYEPITAYVDDVTINDTTYDLERFGTSDVPIMPDADGLTVSLDAGSTYDLHLQGFEEDTTVWLDDIGYDTIEPADSETSSDSDHYAASNDATSIVLTDGTGVLYDVQPLYASDLSTTKYLGLEWDKPVTTEGMMNVVASAYEGVSVSSTATSFKVGEAQTFTATVTKDGAGLGGAKVDVLLDSDMNGVGDTSLATGFTTSSGQKQFTITPAKAGQIILQVTKDIGGTISTFDPDEIDDIDNTTCKTVIDPATYLVSTVPTALYRGWTYADGTIEVTVKDALGELVTGTDIKYSATGCGITAIEDVDATTDDPDGTFKIAGELEPTATGTITLTVNRYLDGDEVADYTGSTSMTVGTAAKFNVDISPTEIPAAEGTPVTASFWDIEKEGPDADVETSLLDNVKVTLSGVGVSETETIDDAATHTFTGVTPEQAGTITATFVGTFDDTTVETKTLDISVTGYKVIDLIPSTALIDTTSHISMTVTTDEDAAVNNAKVTITADKAAGFKKDVDDDGVLDSFKVIVINGPLGEITYDQENPEDFLVNDGYYEVTGIEFAKPGAVDVLVKDAANADKAHFTTAFTVLGEEVYSLITFEPATLTAGVDHESLDITITEAGDPATDVATIIIDEAIFTGGNLSNLGDGVYQVNPALVKVVDTLSVMAKNTDDTKYGSATLEVALPTVSYVITDAGEVERNVMLTGEDYTVSVTVIDALGEVLDGFLWIGTYDEETEAFTALTLDPVLPIDLDADGTGEFDITAPATAGSLVWMIGGGDVEGNAALVLEPAIAVEDLYYGLNPTEATVGVETTYTVTNNYGDPAADRDIKIVTPAIETVLKTTGPAGTPLAGKFVYNAPEVGDYYVSVKLNGTWQAPITVTVSEVEVTLESISALPSSVSLDVGDTQAITVTATYSDASTAVVTATSTYVSVPETVATVSAAGLITAVAEGSATVTVSYETETDTVSVTVGPVANGDFDGDGDVDLADFVEFAAAYGSSTDDPNYDAAGDFDGDGDVDLADFVEFAAVYGT